MLDGHMTQLVASFDVACHTRHVRIRVSSWFKPWFKLAEIKCIYATGWQCGQIRFHLPRW